MPVRPGMTAAMGSGYALWKVNWTSVCPEKGVKIVKMVRFYPWVWSTIKSEVPKSEVLPWKVIRFWLPVADHDRDLVPGAGHSHVHGAAAGCLGCHQPRLPSRSARTQLLAGAHRIGDSPGILEKYNSSAGSCFFSAKIIQNPGFQFHLVAGFHHFC